MSLQCVKLEKENEENKFYKFIWFRDEENHFLRFLVVCKTKKMNKIIFYKFI